MIGQLVSCRATATCNGALGDDVGMAVDGRGCCVDNPRALAFLSSEGSCVPCVGELTLILCQAHPGDEILLCILQPTH